MIRVQSIEPGSIAADLDLPVGLAVMSINGRPIRDGLDLLFYQVDDVLLVEAETPDGQPLEIEIEKPTDEPLGLIPEPDKVRRCTNACPFCFVKGNPKLEKLRAGLYIKDDDYRLSFLHGHYVTLTNLRDDDWERIFEQGLSPLYVSVHATDPDARLRMLVNPRSANINEDLDRLAAGGVDVHAQVVLCPEINDGAILERTISDLYGRGDAVRSLSIVPVGLTVFNADRGVRELTAEECRDTIALIDRARARSIDERGRGWCYAADEMYIQAGLDLPGPAYFDDEDLESNGVGAISALTARVRAAMPSLPRLDGRRVVAVTGRSMGPSLSALMDEIATRTGAQVATAIAPNTLYGPTVTTAGLLPGEDHRAALEPYREWDLALISVQALNDRDVFIDDMSLEGLRASLGGLRVEPSHDVADVLVRITEAA
ncbi:MAG: DUF512 domain-containing protein [Gemmatimonadota bacterium]|nr:DUF512 domain-containing protein [Gemmatimonadota bacterium]